MKKLVSTGALAAAMIVGTSAQAAVTVYTDKAAFLAAAGPVNLEDFSNIATGDYTNGGAFDPVTGFNGFSLSGTGNGDVSGVRDHGYEGTPFDGQNFYGWNINPQTGDGNDGPTTTFTFTSATTAFGFDWFNNDYSDSYSVTLSTGDSYNGPAFGFQSTGFFGVISTVGITSATIANYTYGGYIDDEGLDNVYTSADVPEPAMLGLFGLGALGLGLSRRRKAA